MSETKSPRTIWRYAIPRNSATVSMPKGARILSAMGDWQDVCLWAEVNPDEPHELRHFRVHLTGEELPDNPGNFIGSVLMCGGKVGVHVFEAPDVAP